MSGKLITKLYGGINANATRLNISSNEAESIVNWDIGLDGSLTRRLGAERIVQSMGTPFKHIGKFNAKDGSEVYVAVAGMTIWRSTDLTTWTDVTGSLTFGGLGVVNGCAFKNKYFMTNGVDEPIYVSETGNAETMKAGSILPDVTNLMVARVGGAAGVVVYNYVVTAVTPQGETKPCGVATITADYDLSAIGTTKYNLLTWEPVLGATSHRIYCTTTGGGGGEARNLNGVSTTPTAGDFILIGEVDGITGTFNDNSKTFVPSPTGQLVPCPTTSMAYMTPHDWEDNGYPNGFAVVARGQDDRMLAWRGETVWASGLSDPLNWLGPDDAFVWQIAGAGDNNITAIGSLFDYTLIFTKTDGFLYTGASENTINLNKVVPIGCVSQNSITTVGDDLYFWSQYGPTTMQRVISGADVKNTTQFNNKIQPLIFATYKPDWDQVFAYTMPKQNRVVFWAPNQTGGPTGFAYQYDIGAWTTYSGWYPVNAMTTGDGDVYAGFYGGSGDGALFKLHSGYTDNGTAIVAEYKTGHIDLNNWNPRKRIPWVDVVADRSVGTYDFSVSWNFDMGRQQGGPIQCSQTTTDGSDVVFTSSTTTQHRVYTPGIGNTVQLVFTASTNNQNVKILAYGTEVNSLGNR